MPMIFIGTGTKSILGYIRIHNVDDERAAVVAITADLPHDPANRNVLVVEKSYPHISVWHK